MCFHSKANCAGHLDEFVSFVADAHGLFDYECIS